MLFFSRFPRPTRRIHGAPGNTRRNISLILPTEVVGRYCPLPKNASQWSIGTTGRQRGSRITNACSAPIGLLPLRCRLNLFTSLLLFPLVLLLGCAPGDPASNPSQVSGETREKLSIPIDFGTLTEETNKVSGTIFADEAVGVGLTFQYFNDAASGNLYLPEALGGGVAAFDFDLDGLCDLYFANGTGLPVSLQNTSVNDALFRNEGSRFSHITDKASVREFGYSHGVAIGDFNRDGFEDVLVANLGSPTLFRNQGDGTFESVNLVSALAPASFWLAPLMVDLDGDGFEDLLIASYVDWDYEDDREVYEGGIVGYPSPGQFRGGPVWAAKNLGNGEFEDQTVGFGFLGKTKCLGIGAVDLDLDLRPEIYIANDGDANQLYTTTSKLGFNSAVTNAARESSRKSVEDTPADGTWREVAEWAGVAGAYFGANEASMCVTAADFSRSGLPDLFVTNYYQKKNTLYTNKGDLSFRDTSVANRLDVIGRPYVSFGAIAFDFDLDTWCDLFVANGHVISPNFPINQMPSQLLLNVEGVFFDVSSSAGDYFQTKGLGRAVCSLDAFNEGRVDLVVTYTDRPVAFLRSTQQSEKPRLTFEILDPQHRVMTGARIELRYENHRQVIPVMTGGSYISESQKRWTVGLESPEKAPEVVIHWTDGRQDHWVDLPPDTIWRFSPGQKLCIGGTTR